MGAQEITQNSASKFQQHFLSKLSPEIKPKVCQLNQDDKSIPGQGNRTSHFKSMKEHDV